MDGRKMPVPVSYTHLDVYKRQGVNMAKIEQKQVIVNEIKEKLEKATSVVMVDARGLTVEQDTALRKQLREAGVDYKVYKNTMVHFAIQGTPVSYTHLSETSRQLYIHRNTLVYRLDKLQKMTGLDLRNFDDAIIFKITLMVSKYMMYMDKMAY